MTESLGPSQNPWATYPRTFIEGTLGLPGVIQEVIAIELQQDPPPPKVKGQPGSGQALLQNKNHLKLHQTKGQRWGGGGGWAQEVQGNSPSRKEAPKKGAWQHVQNPRCPRHGV